MSWTLKVNADAVHFVEELDGAVSVLRAKHPHDHEVIERASSLVSWWFGRHPAKTTSERLKVEVHSDGSVKFSSL